MTTINSSNNFSYFVKSMGEQIEVKAIATSLEEASKLMEENSKLSLLDIIDEKIYILAEYNEDVFKEERKIKNLASQVHKELEKKNLIEKDE